MRRVPSSMTVVVMVGVVMAYMVPNTVATHPRPKAASPLQVSLVPFYNQCTSANGDHSPPGPTSLSSCRPPTEASNSVTVGTPDANGAPANSVGSARYAVDVGTPGPPDDSDITIVYSVTDVRCKAGTAACGSTNVAGGADYTGELEVWTTGRWTDHRNTPSGLEGTDPGTVIDRSWMLYEPILTCAATADVTVGATCTASTSANTLAPGSGFIVDGRRQWLEKTGVISVRDGGPDGVTGTEPNTFFATEGIFIP